MDKTTLADHAEEWMKDEGFSIPERNTKEWNDLYAKWINYAFDFEKQRKRAFGIEE